MNNLQSTQLNASIAANTSLTFFKSVCTNGVIVAGTGENPLKSYASALADNNIMDKYNKVIKIDTLLREASFFGARIATIGINLMDDKIKNFDGSVQKTVHEMINVLTKSMTTEQRNNLICYLETLNHLDSVNTE